MKSLDFDWSIRKPSAEDGAFLIDSWLKSYNEQIGYHDRKGGYWRAQKILIGHIFERSKVLVAVRHDMPPGKDIIGYAVGEPGHDLSLHYVYVKKQHRRAGVANAMLSHLRAQCRGQGGGNVVCTHEGCAWVRRKAKDRGWSYQPRGVLYELIISLTERAA